MLLEMCSFNVYMYTGIIKWASRYHKNSSIKIHIFTSKVSEWKSQKDMKALPLFFGRLACLIFHKIKSAMSSTLTWSDYTNIHEASIRTCRLSKASSHSSLELINHFLTLHSTFFISRLLLSNFQVWPEGQWVRLQFSPLKQ